MQQPILPSVNDADFPAHLEAEILKLIQDQAAKLKPQYQGVDWRNATAIAKLNRAISPRLQAFGDRQATWQWVETSLLPKLFQPDYLDLAQADNLSSQLLSMLCADRQLTTSPEALPEPQAEATQQAEVEADRTDSNSADVDITGASSGSENNGIAVLLLDAENIQLKAEEEAFLQQHCPHPIQVKIAFANWRKLGKLDQALHSRSYDLIHVPSGKDHADGKMIAMGTAIHERYPQTKAVLICSSDSIMTSLHSQLAKNQVRAYRVLRSNKGLTLASGSNGDCHTVVLPKPVNLSQEQAIASLEKITFTECQKIKLPVVRLTQVAAAFSSRHQLSLTALAVHYGVGEKALSLLEAHPDKFKLHRLGQPADWFIEPMQTQQLAVAAAGSASLAGADLQTADSQGSSAQPIVSIHSLQELTAALLQCIQQQTSETEPEANVGAIAACFRRRYGEPVSAVLLRFQLSKKLITFLSNQSEFEVRQEAQSWWVRRSKG